MVATTLIPSSTPATPAERHGRRNSLCQSCERMLLPALASGRIVVFASLAGKHVSCATAADTGNRLDKPSACLMLTLLCLS